MSERSRDEHVKWCKERAHEYLAKGDIANAITSMMSDMRKHPDCGYPDVLDMMGMLAITQRDHDGARRFIDGFN